VISLFIAIYLGGWIILTTLVAFAGGKHLRDRRSPPLHPLLVSMVAGAIWPLILLGVAEIGAGVAYGEAQRALARQSRKATSTALAARNERTRSGASSSRPT
jgi:hypothetical protein